MTSADCDEYSFVKTDNFADKILQFCKSRNDDWAFTVRGCVEFFGGDLHAADCVYHKSCDVHFRTFHEIRRQHRLAPESKRKLGSQLTVARNKLFTRCVPTLRRMMKNS